MCENFIYDFFSLENKSLNEWSESFFWPVSREETQSILIDFIEENKRTVNLLGDTFVGNILLIYNQTWNPYIRLANYLLVVDRLKKSGYDLSFSEKSIMMNYIYNEGPFPVEIEDFSKLISDNKIVRIFKNFLLSVRYNFKQGKVQFWHHFIKGRAVYVMPDANVLHVNTTIKEEKWVRITTPEEWITDWENVVVGEDKSSSIKEYANKYHEFALKYMSEKLGLKVSNKLSTDIKEFNLKYFENITKLYECIRSEVKKKKPSRLHVGTGGKTYTRALSLAVKEKNGIVRGHPHGYFMCHSASHRPHYHEFSTVNEFAVYTESMKSLFERNIFEFTPTLGNQLSFISQNTDELIMFREKYNNFQIPKKIKSVMILELQLWVDDIRYEIPETMINYHFYFNLCKTLVNNDYEVIFKKRPKSWGWDNIDFFSDMPNVKVVYDSLENPEIMDMADAIIFQYGLSSTFIPMMCSNKTLIYVDAGWEDWYPDVYDLMKKRCSILKCWNTKENQQKFDESELLEILSKKPQKANMDFFENYLKP